MSSGEIYFQFTQEKTRAQERTAKADSLTGSVRIVSGKTIYFVDGSRIDNDQFSVLKEEYNTTGNKISRSAFSGSDLDPTEEKYFYDNENRLIRETETLSGITSIIYTAEYTPFGALARELLADAEYDPPLSKVYKYDKYNRLFKRLYYLAPANRLEWYEEWSFDASGRIEQVNRYAGDGQRLGYYLYRYSLEKRLSEKEEYGADGKIKTKEKVHRNEKGMMTQYSLYRYEKVVSEIQTLYHENGQKRKERELLYSNPKISEIITEYDQHGNSTSRIMIMRDASVSNEETVLEYVYDENGNWVRSLEKSCVKVGIERKCSNISVTTREITYYKIGQTK